MLKFGAGPKASFKLSEGIPIGEAGPSRLSPRDNDPKSDDETRPEPNEPSCLVLLLLLPNTLENASRPDVIGGNPDETEELLYISNSHIKAM